MRNKPCVFGVKRTGWKYPANNSLMLTRLAGGKAVAQCLRSYPTMKGPGLCRRAAYLEAVSHHTRHAPHVSVDCLAVWSLAH